MWTILTLSCIGRIELTAPITSLPVSLLRKHIVVCISQYLPSHFLFNFLSERSSSLLVSCCFLFAFCFSSLSLLFWNFSFLLWFFKFRLLSFFLSCFEILKQKQLKLPFPLLLLKASRNYIFKPYFDILVSFSFKLKPFLSVFFMFIGFFYCSLLRSLFFDFVLISLFSYYY